jgi:hypothetical protein
MSQEGSDRFRAGIPNEIYLGKPPDEYAEWIRSPMEYGGQVEIMLLAQLKQW